MMSSQAVNLVLPVSWGQGDEAAAEQSAWLRSTRVRLRTISFEEGVFMGYIAERTTL